MLSVRRRGRHLGAALFFLWLGAAQASEPHRVVSANLCADQLVLALADREQIASLSPFARDPSLSFLASQAAGIEQNRGSVEDILRLEADLVLIGAYDSRYARVLLEAKAVPFQILAPWRDFEDGRAQIRSLALALGHPERGEALITRIDQALASARGSAFEARSALVLERRGYVLGRGSLVDDILALAGLRDGAAELGVGAQGFVSIERLVAGRPDYLVVSQANPAAGDQGLAFLTHPALSRLYPPDRRLVVPDRLAICAGPSTPALVATLVSEIRAKVR
jgi:iron complex transport system substrate-binding protein